MPKPEKNFHYVPAELREGKVWQIVYYVEHPQTGEMVRKRVRVNRVKGIANRRKWAKDVARNINEKLANGWNPIIEDEAPRSYTLLYEAFDIYLDQRGGAEDTLRAYRSIINMIKLWMEEEGIRPNLYVVAFDRKMASRFLQWIIIKRKVSNRTYNNYMQFSRTIWNWFIQFEMCNTNPWDGFSKRSVRKKTRIPIPREVLAEIMAYFNTRQKGMQLVCVLMFAAGVRRTEMTKLRCSHIDFERKRILMPSDITKVGAERSPILPDWIMDLLYRFKIDKLPKHYFLVGRNWWPGADPITPKRITDRWVIMRQQLQLPKEYQLYSLRDTGIQTMLRNGVPIDIVKAQFGHQSLEITSAYLVHEMPGAEEILKEKVLEI